MLVAEAAERIARAEGLRGLGMRRIATEIGYAPNSIYNAVGGLDDIVLAVNARTLTRLRDRLADADGAGETRVLALADSYLAFVLAEPRLWSLLFEHTLAPERPYPDWYAEALKAPIRLVESALAPLIPEREARGRAVASLWAALHGLASLATSGKLAAVSPHPPTVLARTLVEGFLAGLPQTA